MNLKKLKKMLSHSNSKNQQKTENIEDFAISSEVYTELKSKYGKYSSWALWNPSKLGKPANKKEYGLGTLVDDLENPEFRKNNLNSSAIILGMNWSDRGEQKPTNWEDFHDTSSHSQDFKLANIIMNSQFKGCYITDVIKNFPENSAHKAGNQLKDPELAKFSAGQLQEEINLIKPKYLIACGKDVEEAIRYLVEQGFLNLKGAKIKEIDHYSSSLSYDKIDKISKELNELA